MLTLGLTDGATFIPFAFSLLSSHHKENRLCPMDASVDGRSKRARLRNKSQEKAPEVLLKLLDGALKHCPLVQTIPSSLIAGSVFQPSSANVLFADYQWYACSKTPQKFTIHSVGGPFRFPLFSPEFRKDHTAISLVRQW